MFVSVNVMPISSPIGIRVLLTSISSVRLLAEVGLIRETKAKVLIKVRANAIVRALFNYSPDMESGLEVNIIFGRIFYVSDI